MPCLPTSQQDACDISVSQPQLNLEAQLELLHCDDVLAPSGNLFRRLVLKRLQRIDNGCLVIQDGTSRFQFGNADAKEKRASLVVRDSKFYKRVALGGSLGAAESYIQGEWDSPDLPGLLSVLGRNTDTLSRVDGLGSKLLKPIRVGLNYLRRNSKSGSRKNISAHYDLSNDFFSLMLDPSMTYSSAVFNQESMSLAEAQKEKYDRVCRKLHLQPNDHVLEIGTGWGGFALHAAQNYGCKVTTTTISQEQHRYAADQFKKSGMQNRITLLQQDYRDLRGQYDKLVSIEMIEAVGQQYLNGYFEQCSKLLKPSGAMCIQAITIPDHRYDAYRRSVDFIQKYIFPGGFLPSFRVICESLSKQTDFRLFHSEDFGPHYAMTLDRWRKNFWEAIVKVQQMGFDNRFVRTWDYYLSYCQAGFDERLIGVSQIVLTKPRSNLNPLV